MEIKCMCMFVNENIPKLFVELPKKALKQSVDNWTATIERMDGHSDNMLNYSLNQWINYLATLGTQII